MRRRGGPLGALVYLHEAQVVLGDRARARGALDLAVDVGLERIPPDRAPNREPDETVDGCRLREPMVDLGVVRAAPQDNAHDAVAAAGARLGDEHFAVRARIDPLDL